MAAVNKLTQRKREPTPSASCQLRQRAHSSLPPEIQSSTFIEEKPLSFYNRVDVEMWRKKKRKEKAEVMYTQQVQPLEGKRAITYQVDLERLACGDFINTSVVHIDCKEQRNW